jgi:protein O-GlcNAc transferase
LPDNAISEDSQQASILNNPVRSAELQLKLQEAQTFLQAQEWQSARAAFQKICALSTDDLVMARAWLGVGYAHLGLSETKEATQSLARAHKLAPSDSLICAAYAKLLLQPATLKDAIAVLSRGLAAAADSIDLLGLLADAYDSAGLVNEAIHTCEALRRLEPQNLLARLKLGRLRMIRGDYEESLDQFKFVLSEDPDNIPALDGLSDIYRIQGQLSEAKSALLKRSEVSQTDQEKAAYQLKAALTQPVIARDAREIDEARALLIKTLSDGPKSSFDDPWVLGLGPCFYLGYQARDDREIQQSLAAYYLKLTPSLGQKAPHIGRPVSRKKRLRVGIVSNFFAKHTIGYLSYGLIAGLDREKFEVRLYRTPRAISDTWTPRFREAAPCTDLPADLKSARELLCDEHLDILHYPEIGMDHFTYFLAFARLATVQSVTWGHPITTGLPNIDIFLSVDAMEPPHAELNYSERLVRLRELSINAEQPQDVPIDASNPIFEPNRPSYLCPQSLFKLHFEFDATIARLLEVDTDGLIYFISMTPNADSRFKSRLERKLDKNIERVVFLPRVSTQKFLQSVKAADVILDVPHWSGGKTSLDAFAMGTPIVHQPEEFMRGRHTLAFYRRMGIDSTIVDGPETYAATAARLVHENDFRKSVREQIAARRGDLFGNVSAIREIEDIWAAAIKERS